MGNLSDEELYAKEKVEFVSNLQGTNISDLLCFINMFALLHFLSVLFKIYCNKSVFFGSKKQTEYSFILDYLFLLVPLICIKTLLADTIQIVQMVLIALLFVMYYSLKSNNSKEEQQQPDTEINKQIVKIAINVFRVITYASTVIAILAVDFRIFPRRLAKTETYGVSLMDLGVGFFMMCHSVKIIRNTRPDEKPTMIREFLTTLKSSSVLLILGILRLVSVKATSYAEHTSEYGVHWNFLFTTVVVKLAAVPFQDFVRNHSFKAFLFATVVALQYQLLLTGKNYSAYVLNDKASLREKSLIDANKEGIYSCFGYLAIYLVGQSACYRLSNILNSQKKEEVTSLKPALKCVFNIFAMAMFFSVCYTLTSFKLEKTSRRLCNLSFVCLVAMTGFIMLTFYLVTVIMVAKIFFTRSSKKPVSFQLQQAFSFALVFDAKYIGLILFIVSNIMTGLVNMSVRTLRQPALVSFGIVCLYTFVSFYITLIIYRYLNSGKKESLKQN